MIYLLPVKNAENFIETTIKKIIEIASPFEALVEIIHVYEMDTYTAQENMDKFKHGLRISEVLKTKRGLNTKGVKLSEVNASYPSTVDHIILLLLKTLTF